MPRPAAVVDYALLPDGAGGGATLVVARRSWWRWHGGGEHG
ncbi:hypothetical protein ES332_D13G275300v1 [Gossypium tomentosum]|uniref:Uncharacterized protein n=1 Tax=Gossypium tomentosum TaxID=34277 RepID=A0A5D2I408_GOSTO|nr:hypothetical protein ES332_D13G275300v1 [Gossypium tomentosum]